MTRSRHKRRLFAAASCSVLIIIIFLLTMRSGVGFVGSGFVTGVSGGALVMGAPPWPYYPRGWNFATEDYEVRILWFPVIETNAQYMAIGVPLWIPFLITAGFAFVSWRRLRACSSGHCRKCAYDLTGNVSGVCPECGTIVRNVETQKNRNA